MDTVVIINEECHGFIGVAKDMASAADFVIRNHWVESFTEMWNGWDEEGKNIYTTIKDKANECGLPWEDFVIDCIVNEDYDAVERMGLMLTRWTLYDKDKVKET